MITLKILICADGSKNSLDAVKKGAEIAGGCKADEVTLIHIYPHTYVGAYKYSQVEQYVEMQETRKKAGQKILNEAAKVFEGSEIPVKKVLKEGVPTDVLVEQANSGNYDMVVIGSRGAGGMKKALMGSVSSAVVQKAHISVLLVK